MVTLLALWMFLAGSHPVTSTTVTTTSTVTTSTDAFPFPCAAREWSASCAPLVVARQPAPGAWTEERTSTGSTVTVDGGDCVFQAAAGRNAQAELVRKFLCCTPPGPCDLDFDVTLPEGPTPYVASWEQDEPFCEGTGASCIPTARGVCRSADGALGPSCASPGECPTTAPSCDLNCRASAACPGSCCNATGPGVSLSLDARGAWQVTLPEFHETLRQPTPTLAPRQRRQTVHLHLEGGEASVAQDGVEVLRGPLPIPAVLHHLTRLRFGANDWQPPAGFTGAPGPVRSHAVRVDCP